MIEMKITFGAFISEKRIERGVSLRAFSRKIEISPEYLSKIENNLRSAPKDITLVRIAEILILNDEERELLFDLAAETRPYLSIAYDLVKYINENEMLQKTLRLAKRNALTNNDWKEIFEHISKNHL